MSYIICKVSYILIFYVNVLKQILIVLFIFKCFKKINSVKSIKSYTNVKGAEFVAPSIVSPTLNR